MNQIVSKTTGDSDVLKKEFPLFYSLCKRVCDIAISLMALAVLLPVILLFALIVMIETPGSPFFLQERLGQSGRPFTIMKLRSMYSDAEKNGAQWAVKNDSRVTKVGKLIRQTRIDELPQLWNVLKGDMSIVGPRPERAVFIEEFQKTLPAFSQRLAVKPGLTGWAQINGGYELTPAEKLELDLYYIHHTNIRFDVKIMMKTLRVIVTGDGSR
ncbi:sugar transferase [Priestia megaterium]|uniref:sugar transferase n=1 Tax=Priestia megaterium TaxID=1404 RepID=UPI000D518063|nr:sugar transferase [Priestia megaterium]PVE67206.1 UDP-phosphate N-acetylgalactosaminyl-1-phosphate transferase [Priestia megaterium]PVE84268.1 UDP-phosphate N-acetylgalactosaminyl-1-phosphate transferase [Priestia megaterium]PVE91371.1 UDP-phosphate N-acetylgalactosaminyl-1-phosphate transferase [Priestia megaterium]PVE94458.1 UDP-phosphate N-acetylgalactosaminyl-1-phosphate transferase [Priestia megaterium]